MKHRVPKVVTQAPRKNRRTCRDAGVHGAWMDPVWATSRVFLSKQRAQERKEMSPKCVWKNMEGKNMEHHGTLGLATSMNMGFPQLVLVVIWGVRYV